MITRNIVGAALCAASIVGVGSAVAAGEVTGGPVQKETGMREHANSACGFSGLEDHREYQDLADNPKPGRLTQTPHFVRFDIPDDPALHAWAYPPPGAPGAAEGGCRGGTGGGG